MLSDAGINWGDLEVLSDVGINWEIWGIEWCGSELVEMSGRLSEVGINWEDVGVMSGGGVNWMDVEGVE